MKVNKYQKIVLLLYGTAFIYFSIIHVPFKIKRGNEIVYDTLFSNRANIDFGRLSLVIIITTIIAASLLLLVHNLRLTFKPRLKSAFKLKTIYYTILGIIVIALSAFFLFKKYNNNLDLNKSPLSLDSTSTVAQSDTMLKDPLGIFKTMDTVKQLGIPPFLKNRYLYKGKLFRFKDIQDAAKQSNLDMDSYIKKARIVVIDENGLPIK